MAAAASAAGLAANSDPASSVPAQSDSAGPQIDDGEGLGVLGIALLAGIPAALLALFLIARRRRRSMVAESAKPMPLRSAPTYVEPRRPSADAATANTAGFGEADRIGAFDEPVENVAAREPDFPAPAPTAMRRGMAKRAQLVADGLPTDPAERSAFRESLIHAEPDANNPFRSRKARRRRARLIMQSLTTPETRARSKFDLTQYLPERSTNVRVAEPA